MRLAVMCVVGQTRQSRLRIGTGSSAQHVNLGKGRSTGPHLEIRFRRQRNVGVSSCIVVGVGAPWYVTCCNRTAAGLIVKDHSY